MISIDMLGNCEINWKKRSLEIIRVTTSPLARTVAVRGTSHRIAVSPRKSFFLKVATVTGPLAVATMTSASPSMMM